jgi:hypothetical protein
MRRFVQKNSSAFHNTGRLNIACENGPIRAAEKLMRRIEIHDCTLPKFQFRQVEYGGESPNILGGP